MKCTMKLQAKKTDETVNTIEGRRTASVFFVEQFGR